MLAIALAPVVFVLSAMLDFADCRCTLAVTERAANRAALWSIFQYMIGAVGFIVVINVSWWLMIPEGLGLYCGTRLALRKDPCTS